MNNKNRKRKKSFFQQTAKYGKKGNYGRGTNIDEETFQYFLHILKVLNHDLESVEDKEMFAENVFKQLEGNEVSYSCNQVISFIVEQLLPSISDETLVKFMDKFSANPRPICTDPYSSFVLQKLLIVCTKRLNKGNHNDDGNSELYSSYRTWLLKIAKFAVNNLEHFLWDPHGNPVIRTVLSCLAGFPDLNTKTPETEFNEIVKNGSSDLIDEECKAVIKCCVTHLSAWPEFSELPFNNVVSGLLQIALYAVSVVDKKLLKSFSLTLMKECFSSAAEHDEKLEQKVEIAEQNKIPRVFENNSSLRLLEVIIKLSTQKLWIRIYANFFLNNLLKLSTHEKANFSVQKLIMYCHEKEEFQELCNALLPHLKDIVSAGNTGVILQLCQGCVKFKTLQSQFMENWFHCLKCDDDQQTRCFSFLCTLYLLEKNDLNPTDNESEQNDDNNKQVSKIALHGSLLLQSMLRFNKPIKIIKSILDVEPSKLVSILCDPRGSYIADAFFDSEYIGEKSRDNFMKKLQGFYVTLCCSRNGSRVFDIIWKYAKMKSKISIINELCDQQSKLESDQYGKCISRNISVHTFRHRREDWINAHNNQAKITELFSEFL